MYSMNYVEYTIIIIMLLMLLYIDGYPYNAPHHYHGDPYHHYGTYNWGYPSHGHGNCFSGDSLVKLSNGQDKQINSLNIGDEILTIDQSKITSTQMIMMLDKHVSKKALFYTIKTSCDSEISLTKYHLIPIISYQEKLNYKFAKEIQLGDFLYGLYNNKLKYCQVINITNEIKKGYYAPLTMKGTLIVNQILASSFSHFNNHNLAQNFMFPFRFYYKLTRFIHLNDPFYIYNNDGLNWIIKIMFYFAHYFQPDCFFF